MKFWKKKKPFSKLELGVEVKRCMECPSHLRPCLVDRKVCIFHRWVDHDVSADSVRGVSALVEYPDGSVGMVEPALITFLDREDDRLG
jgi:hypothetical protein